MDFSVKKQKITLLNNETIAENSLNYLYANFIFDESWNGFSKTAVFENGDAVYEAVITDNTCLVPHETITEGDLFVGVKGIKNSVRITTDKCKCEIKASPNLSGNNSTAATPSVVEQLTALVGSANTAIQNAIDNFDVASIESATINSNGHLILNRSDGQTIDCGEVTVDVSGKADKTDTYTKTEIDTALAGKADENDIPTKTSDLTNDSGYLTAHQSLSAYRTSSAQDVIDNNMQTDINAIEGKIPSQATSSNQLADKNFVNSSISTNTAALVADITTNASNIANHTSNTSNPHSVTKAQIGLGNVDNTSDVDKPISTATQIALNTKQSVLDDLSIIREGARLGKMAVQDEDLADVAFTGSYHDLNNKPSIPSAVTEATVSGWGFTKNAGTVTGITMNGASKGTSGVINLGTVITAHQDISGKEDTGNKVTSLSSSSADTQYPSAKCVYDIVGNIESALEALL